MKAVEFARLFKEGSEFSLELSLSQWRAADDRFFNVIIRGITECKEEVIYNLAFHDELTRLSNCGLLNDRLESGGLRVQLFGTRA